MRNFSTPRWLLVLVFGLIMSGCESGSVSVPTTDAVAKWFPEFYFQSLPLTGIHVDYDADSMIFRYDAPTDDVPVWLEKTRAIAISHGWEVTHEEYSASATKLFLRRIDDTNHRYGNWHSVELLRIITCSGVLLFGAIQIDVSDDSSLAEISANGTPWHQTTFLPLFTRQADDACQSATKAATKEDSGSKSLYRLR